MSNMFVGRNPTEVIKHLGSRGTEGINVALTGTISSIDPKKYMAKVKIPLLDQETGWLPIGALMAGNGYGIIAIPERDTEVTVVFEGGDLQSGKILLANFNDVDIPPQGLNPGEIFISSKDGATVKLAAGKVAINGGTKPAARVGDSVDLDPQSPTYGQIVTGNSSVLI